MSVIDLQATDKQAHPYSGSRWLLSVPEAQHELRISRTQIFRLLASRDLQSIKIGRRRLIPIAAIEAYIAHQQELEREGRP